MKKICFIILMSTSLVLGQTFTRDSGEIVNGSNISFISGNHLPDSFLNSNGKTLNYNEIKGSPYIDNFSGTNNSLPIGRIYTAEVRLMGSAYIRYNAYTDNVEVSLQENSKDYSLLKKKENYVYVEFNNKKYRAYSHGDNQIGFFVIVSEKDTDLCTLLKKEKIIFKEETKPKSSFLSPIPPSFKRVKDQYYFKINEKMIETPTKKKELISLLVEHQSKVRDYLNDNKLKLTKEKDLLAIVNFYNSLDKD